MSKTRSDLYGINRLRQRFRALTKTKHWAAVQFAAEQTWEHVGNWDEPWHQVHDLCVTLSRSFGLPIGPRACQCCYAFLVLDEDGDGLDPEECPACERDSWLEEWREEQQDLAEHLRRAAMTLEELFFEDRQRYEQMTHILHGLIARDVQ